MRSVRQEVVILWVLARDEFITKDEASSSPTVFRHLVHNLKRLRKRFRLGYPGLSQLCMSGNKRHVVTTPERGRCIILK